MSFQQQLAHIVHSVEGSQSCIFMDQDGLPIDTYTNHHVEAIFDSNMLAIEYTGMFDQLVKIHQLAHFGATRELVLCCEKAIAIIQFVNPSFFLILTLYPHGNVGKGRYLLRIAAQQLQHELT
jgi:predicted regulator of Ras-like GTPase activity (Roadblock/LC7/MglB family)